MNRQPQKPDKTPLFPAITAQRPEAVVRTLKEQIALFQRARLPAQQGPISSGCPRPGPTAAGPRLPPGNPGGMAGGGKRRRRGDPGLGGRAIVLPGGGSAGRARFLSGTLSAGHRPAGDRPGAIDRRAGDEPGRQPLGPGPIVALPGSGGGPGVAGQARRPHLSPAAIGGRGRRRTRAFRPSAGGRARALLGGCPAAGGAAAWRGIRGTTVESSPPSQPGGAAGRQIDLEIDDETRTLRLAPRLAAAKDPRRAAGA